MKPGEQQKLTTYLKEHYIIIKCQSLNLKKHVRSKFSNHYGYHTLIYFNVHFSVDTNDMNRRHSLTAHLNIRTAVKNRSHQRESY